MIPVTLDTVDRLMEAGVAQRVFPGAVLWVARQGQVVFHRAYGWADLFSRRPMTLDTVFDLSSLTKPLATTMAIMRLVQQGVVELDQPLRAQWPEMGQANLHITVRNLLNHSSGLPAWRPYFMQLRSVPAPEREGLLRRWILAEPPAVGEVYSDLGFMLLHGLVEVVTGLRLDQYLAQTVYRDLGVGGLFFIDLNRPCPDLAYAATELCPWRHRLLLGEVHDDNAHALGGVTGHAGLFGTAAAVGELLRILLAAEHTPATPLVFEPALVTSFFESQPGYSRALGFDTPAPAHSSAGHLFSPGSVGHLGFTGTSFWMDRQRGIIITLLTNRVHPTRHNPGIKRFRPRLHDEIMMTLLRDDDAPSS